MPYPEAITDAEIANPSEAISEGRIPFEDPDSGIRVWKLLPTEELIENIVEEEIEAQTTSGDFDGEVNGMRFLNFYRLSRDN